MVQHSEMHRDMAKFVAIVIRNAMEDFHCADLSDAQMKELNPIIRNAVYTALHAGANAGKSEAAMRFLEFNTLCIPSYWEAPELLEDYQKKMEQEEPKPKKKR